MTCPWFVFFTYIEEAKTVIESTQPGGPTYYSISLNELNKPHQAYTAKLKFIQCHISSSARGETCKFSKKLTISRKFAQFVVRWDEYTISGKLLKMLSDILH